MDRSPVCLDSVWGQALVLFLTGVILGLPSMPFSWWHTFRLDSVWFNEHINTLDLRQN